MSVYGHPLIQMGDRTLFAVNIGEQFTVPSMVTTLAPTADYVPTGVAGSFRNSREVSGGQLIFAFSDAAGPNNVTEVALELNAGDVIALATIGAGKSNVLVNGVIKHAIPATAVASVIGIYG